MHLGQVVAGEDGVTALGEARHADRVIDCVCLRPPTGAELEIAGVGILDCPLA